MTRPRNRKPRGWLFYATFTTVAWGIWGAFIEIPEHAGFPATLGYAVWALTMIPCAAVALRNTHSRVDSDGRALLLGGAIGFLGAGGQLLLFQALRSGPAYLVFPIISLYPLVTIVLSVTLLRERAEGRPLAGIVLALPAIVLLSYVEPTSGGTTGYGWLLLAVTVLFMWGAQAFVLKKAQDDMSAEGIFFYMALTAVLLVPVALLMTDFSAPINWGLRGPYLAALVHILNAAGALSLVYAMRYGKAIIVVPMTALAPVITIVLSLLIYRELPSMYHTIGMLCAVLAIYLFATESPGADAEHPPVEVESSTRPVDTRNAGL
ncbi:MAG: EamA family transporter [Luteitalea sp.]|nr:EamA family transporter [Luteitalea sp.]